MLKHLSSRFFIKLFETTLVAAKCSVKSLELLEREEIVVLTFDNGYEKRVNIACNSKLAIISDVLKACM